MPSNKHSYKTILCKYTLMMMVDKLDLNLISECFVRPKYDIEKSKKPHHLIGLDLLMLSLGYIQLGFLYTKPTSKEFDMNSFVEKMKDSFSYALVHYYPLAGRFTTVTYEDEHACSIHVDCNKGPGARFIHASCEHVTVSDIVDSLPVVRCLFDLGERRVINYDGHTQALVSLQVTELEDGIVVGVTMNHSVADGASFLNFVSSLSELFKSENDDKKHTLLTNSPIFTPFLPDGCELLQKLPFLEPDEFITRVDKDTHRLEERIFRFSTSSISKLKERANSELGPATPGKISSFQAFAAFVWMSIIRARKIPAQAMTTCLIPINCRARFRPPLSRNHFSNQAQALMMTKNVGELLENGLGSASIVLHNGIIGYYDHQVSTRYHKVVMENPQVLWSDDQSNDNMNTDNLVNFSWGPRFDIYGVDFGLGKVVASPSGSIDNREGAVIMKPGREGGGSIDLELALFRESLIALESDNDFMAYVS